MNHSSMCHTHTHTRSLANVSHITHAQHICISFPMCHMHTHTHTHTFTCKRVTHNTRLTHMHFIPNVLHAHTHTHTHTHTQDKHKQRQLAKAKAWEAKCSNACQPIKPLKVGCVWLNAVVSQEQVAMSREQVAMSRDEQLLRQFTAITLSEIPISVETAVAVHTKGEGKTLPLL